MATVVQVPGTPAPEVDPLAAIFVQAFERSRQRKSEEEQLQKQFALDALLEESKQEARKQLEAEKTKGRRELEEFKQDALLDRVMKLETERQKGSKTLAEFQASKAVELEAFKQKGRLQLEQRKAELDEGTGDTETQRDVASIVRTTPELAELFKTDPQAARDKARGVLRNEDVALRQLEEDLRRKGEAGEFLPFASEKERVAFEFSRSHLRSALAAEPDPGKAVEEAKRRGKESVTNLEFLPEELQQRVFTREGLGRDPQVVLGDMQSVIETLMESDFVEQLQTDEEKFNEALKLLQNRVAVGENAAEQLRRRVLGEPQVEEEEEEGVMDTLRSLLGG